MIRLLAIRETLDPAEIYLEAQCYAEGFYAREGFTMCSEPFDEDGIPHVQMRLRLSQGSGETRLALVGPDP